MPKPTLSVYFIASVESCGLQSAKNRSTAAPVIFESERSNRSGNLRFDQSKPQ